MHAKGFYECVFDYFIDMTVFGCFFEHPDFVIQVILSTRWRVRDGWQLSPPLEIEPYRWWGSAWLSKKVAERPILENCLLIVPVGPVPLKTLIFESDSGDADFLRAARRSVSCGEGVPRNGA